MAVKFICDGCGKEKEGFSNDAGDFFKPSEWYKKTDLKSKKTFVACSIECTKKISKKEGGTNLIFPF